MYEPGLYIRSPNERDVDKLAVLIFRFYSFNEEFDPAWSLASNAEEVSRELALEYIKDGGGVVLIADYDGQVVGYLRAVVRENRILAWSKIGVIQELYVLPPYRGRGIAKRLVEEAGRKLRELGVRHIAAEFPALNYVAENFYKEGGFRPYLNVYVRDVEV
ncbi:MAG: GNAT family N-acetyltransferase [Desulfurococcales archaeon]|nr:GNAT family N-acetyltransferase [Desulfurococcales archaeon]